ncbi:methyltransferase small domain-containing protein [Sarocladium implicatum]|nr:methyltransferase small domain-containing protein [Sarocladium implicatum]
MPRIPPWTIRRARYRSPHVATLLPACRDIPSAQHEFRWIREHVQDTYSTLHEHRIAKLCSRRGRGEPLQYVLGSQPFGSLDIKCRPGVLIPRPETEAYTSYLAELLKSQYLGSAFNKRQLERLRIIDFCTGTGCIPLLLYSMLRNSARDLDVCGVDISTAAVALAESNFEHNLATGELSPMDNDHSFSTVRGDVFDEKLIRDLASTPLDVLISNPPYVSKDVWHHGRGQLGFSVRKHEPRLALVPGEHLQMPEGVRHEDVFYARLLDIAQQMRPRILLLEIGDEAQALRVVERFNKHSLAFDSQVELWRDWPDLEPGPDEPTHHRRCFETKPCISTGQRQRQRTLGVYLQAE